MNVKEFLTAFLGKTLNVPADKVASLLTDDGKEVKAEALTELLGLDTSRVQKFKDEQQTFFENGQKKATKELMVDFEKKVKEKFGVTSDKKGEELIEELITLKANDKSTIDETKVKAHPAYTAMQNELNQKIVETDNNWKTKWEGAEKERSYETSFSKMWDKAETLLSGFALPENAEIKKNQLNWLKNELRKNNYDLNNDDILVKTKEGKLLEDQHGNRVTFDSYIKNAAAQYWPAIQGKEREGSGGQNNQGGNGAAGANIWKGKITNDAEYTAAIQKATEGKDRIAIQDSYKEYKAASGK